MKKLLTCLCLCLFVVGLTLSAAGCAENKECPKECQKDKCTKPCPHKDDAAKPCPKAAAPAAEAKPAAAAQPAPAAKPAPAAEVKPAAPQGEKK